MQFGIFRKPTLTLSLIPHNSHHLFKHKLSAFHSLIHRAVNIPMSIDNRFKEIQIIKQQAHANNFSMSTINKILKKHERQFLYQHLMNTELQKDMQYRKFTYQGDINTKIEKLLRKYNIICATSQKLNTLNQLKNAKDPTPFLEKNGVYSIKCDECEAMYIGETGRQIKTRVQEHVKDIRCSNFGKHLHETGHRFSNWENVKLLHQQEKGIKLTLLEAFEINKHKKNDNIKLLNDQINLFYCPLFKQLRPP